MAPATLIRNDGDRGTPEDVTNQQVGGEHTNERNMTALHECNIPIASIPHNPYFPRCLTLNRRGNLSQNGYGGGGGGGGGSDA